MKTIKLLWNVQLPGTPRQMHSLFSRLILKNVATTSGPKEIAVIAGISDEMRGFDTAAGKEVWHDIP